MKLIVHLKVGYMLYWCIICFVYVAGLTMNTLGGMMYVYAKSRDKSSTNTHDTKQLFRDQNLNHVVYDTKDPASYDLNQHRHSASNPTSSSFNAQLVDVRVMWCTPRTITINLLLFCIILWKRCQKRQQRRVVCLVVSYLLNVCTLINDITQLSATAATDGRAIEAGHCLNRPQWEQSYCLPVSPR